MFVSIDGGKTYLNTKEQEVRVIYRNIDIVGDRIANSGEVHITLTHEGIFSYVWSGDKSLESNIGTKSQTIYELVEELAYDNGDNNML